MRFSQGISLLLMAVSSQAMPLFNGGFEDPPAVCGSPYVNASFGGSNGEGNCVDGTTTPFFERFSTFAGWLPVQSGGGTNFERWNYEFNDVPAKEGVSFIELNTEGLTTIQNHPLVEVENCDMSTIKFYYRARTQALETFKVTLTNMDNGKVKVAHFTSEHGVWNLGVVGPIMVMNQDSLKVEFMSTNGEHNNGQTFGNFIDDVQEECTTPSMAMDPHVTVSSVEALCAALICPLCPSPSHLCPASVRSLEMEW